MPRFAILPHESANRVYGSQVTALLTAELGMIAPHLDAAVDDIRPTTLGGVGYLTFRTDRWTDSDRFVIGQLSGTRALFRLESDDQDLDDILLRPEEIERLAVFDDDLVTTQRYPGKTNEQFTHLLLNVGVAASAAAHERAADGKAVRVLDPVAGRGTTLNRALLNGYDATGIEMAEADVDQYRTFLTTYLRQHRIKHRITTERIRKGPAAGTSRFVATIRGRVERDEQRCEMIRADTADAALVLSERSADVVVADLPYGVQHRAATAAARRRSPGELLDTSLAGWRRALRGGGAMALAWNLKTLPRDEVERTLVAHGFEIVPGTGSFEHVVDRSITRDVIVARLAGTGRINRPPAG